MNGKFNILNFDPSVNAYIEASAARARHIPFSASSRSSSAWERPAFPKYCLSPLYGQGHRGTQGPYPQNSGDGGRWRRSGKSLFKEVFSRETATDKERSCFRNALSDIDLASIYPIHSFCERVSFSRFETNPRSPLAQTSDDAVTAFVEKGVPR